MDLKVGANRKEEITGNDERKVTGKASATIMGSESRDVTGGRTTNITGPEKLTVTGPVEISAVAPVKIHEPKAHFTVGIIDDISHTSIEYDPDFDIESPLTTRCVFWGLGADGTVGVNKNSIKIIGEETDNFAQGFFVYDSKKSGTVTVSHLRFGPKPIRAPYLINKASFVACHQFSFLERIDMLSYAAPGSVFLLNSIYGPDGVWNYLPREVQNDILKKKLKFYVIDAYVAQKTGRRAARADQPGADRCRPSKDHRPKRLPDRMRAAGLADERLVAALDGLVSGNLAVDRIVEYLRAWGHTSGSAALRGMGLAIT